MKTIKNYLINTRNLNPEVAAKIALPFENTAIFVPSLKAGLSDKSTRRITR